VVIIGFGFYSFQPHGFIRTALGIDSPLPALDDDDDE
jgi:hypothetical protein